MLSTLFLSLTLLFSAFSYNAWLEKFRTSLHQPKGVQFSITITQNELNTISLTSAFVQMQDSSKMAIDMEKEAIIVIGDTIKTFNKITKQLIIDKIISSEFGLFTLIKGNINHSYLTKTNLMKEHVRLDFKIDEYDYSGFFEIGKDGTPQKMHLYYAQDQYIKIDVSNFKAGLKNNESFALPRYEEVINLYE